jgi:hypothetical protein
MISIARALGLTPKARKVLTHLESRGSISHAEALITHGLPKVARQIWELRKAGMSIATDLRRDAAGTRYARYVFSRI